MVDHQPRPPWGRVVRYDPSRDPWRPYHADGLTPAKAASLLKSADAGELSSLLELAEEIQERDAHLTSVTATRRAALTLLEWKIEPASERESSRAIDRVLAKATADYCQQILEDIKGFDLALRHLSRAIISNLAVLELVWGGLDRLIDVVPIEDSRLTADYTKDKTIRIRTQQEPLKGIPAEGGKFVIHMPRAETGYPTRGTLIRSALLLYLGKSYGFKDWLVFAEVFGMPVRAAKYDANSVTEAEKQEALEMLQLLGTDAVGIFSKALDLELIETPQRGRSPHRELVEYCDRQMSILILGQQLTTETTGATGTYAAAKVHENVRGDLMLQDRKDEAAAIRDQLLAPMVRWRFGRNAPVPQFTRVVDEPVDRKVEAEVASVTLQQVRAPILKSEFYERVGYSEPGEGDEVIKPAEQPAGAGFPGFGGG